MANTGTVYYPGGNYQNFQQGPEVDQSTTAASGIVASDWDHTLDGKAEDLDALLLTPVAGKDPDDISRYIRTNDEGKLIVTFVTDEGETGEVELEDLLTAGGLKVVNLDDSIYFEEILKELKKQNIHLQSMTDERILDVDVDQEYV
jgi:hypothetical protein